MSAIFLISYPDGASGAPVGGNGQRADFFTSARQSGQTYATRPPWRVAGVDYAVGIPAASFPLKVPGVDALPSGATYSAITKGVTCTGVASPTFDGWDFNNKWLEFTSTVTGTITVKNCNFLNGANSNTQFGMIFVDTGCTANFVYNNNFLDQAAQSFSGSVQTKAHRIFTTGTKTYRYNWWQNIIGNNVLLIGNGDTIIEFDYTEGIGYDTQQHGEWTAVAPDDNGTMGLFRMSYCTLLNPSTFGSGMTSSIYGSNGIANGSKIKRFLVERCTLVQNVFYFSGSISGTTLSISAINTTISGSGVPYVGMKVLGPGVTAGTTISSVGATAIGDHTLNKSMTVAQTSALYTLPSSCAGVEISYIDMDNILYDNNYIDGSGAFVGVYFVDVGGGGTRPTAHKTNNIDIVSGGAI